MRRGLHWCLLPLQLLACMGSIRFPNEEDDDPGSPAPPSSNGFLPNVPDWGSTAGQPNATTTLSTAAAVLAEISDAENGSSGVDLRSGEFRDFHCRTHANQFGVCKEILACAGLLDLILNGRFPNICSWRSFFPVVCCPTGIPPFPPTFQPTFYPSFPGGFFTPTPTRPRPNSPHPFPSGATSINDVCGGTLRLRKRQAFLFPDEVNEIPSTRFRVSTQPPPAAIQPENLQLALSRLKDFYDNAPENHLGAAVVLDNQEALKKQAVEFPAPLPPSPPPPSDDFRKTLFIVGGTESTPHSLPWMASVGTQDSLGDVDFICGGSLISENFVLTAAHCTERVLQIRIERTIPHPGYAPPAKYHDIALLKLVQRVRFTRTVSPVCLPPPNYHVPSDALVTVAGWGRTRYGGRPSNSLQEVTIDLVENRLCEGIYKSKGGFQKSFAHGLQQGVICAGTNEGGKDSCQGDSGGPLVYRAGSTSPYIVVGVVSTGIGCGNPGVPGIYTRVAEYLDFIYGNADLRVTRQ